MKATTSFSDKTATVGIVGLGYVGLPLLLAYASKGVRTIGFDIDESKISAILAGESYIAHIDSTPLRDGISSGCVDASSDFRRVAEVDALILCLPTPLDEHLEPDLSYVRNTLDAVVPHLKPGTALSLESTTYPGTTAEELLPRVRNRGLVPGESVYLLYSPEREDPGNREYSARNIPKVVGGVTPECLRVGKALYSIVFEQVIPVSSPEVAELSKLLENIYRAVNIGLVNELKTVADAMNIDIWEVISAAATKPFGFTPFYPGPGLGGHCIPIDPFYLTWKAREFGVHTRFIELAGEVNRSMPAYVVERTMIALNKEKKALNGSKILLLGLAYKADVDDMRESPTFELLDRFSSLGGVVSYFDPHIATVGPTREHREWQGMASIRWEEEAIRNMDAVVIVTRHGAVNYGQLAEWASLIVDTRNAMAGIEGRALVVKA